MSKYILEYEMDGYEKVKLTFEGLSGFSTSAEVMYDGTMGLMNEKSYVLSVISYSEMIEKEGDDVKELMEVVKNRTDEEWEQMIEEQDVYEYMEYIKNGNELKLVNVLQKDGFKNYMCMIYDLDNYMMYGISYVGDFDLNDILESFKTVEIVVED